jgi:hypothetical protein
MEQGVIDVTRECGSTAHNHYKKHGLVTLTPKLKKIGLKVSQCGTAMRV